jgi:hypothetical protein
VKRVVKENAYDEKCICICTGIGQLDQAMSVNTTVRKRAKAACEFDKKLNANLSTWFQSKPTLARSHADKVSPTIKISSESFARGADPSN